MWISELESAMLGTVRIGTYVTEQEAYEKTDEWLRNTYVTSGKKKKSMLKVINESFSDDVHIYECEDAYNEYAWEENDD